MNKTLKTGKKALSLVLSVLMLMSCFVFAPVANAADENLEVTIKCTDRLPFEFNHGRTKFIKLIVKTDANENKEFYLYNKTGNYRSSIIDKDGVGKDCSVTFTEKITGKITSVKIIFSVYSKNNYGASIELRTTIKVDGKNIVENELFSYGTERGDFVEQNGDGGKERDLVSTKKLANATYPTYTVNFYGLDGVQIGSTQNVAFGESATAPALPSQAPNDTYHYTVSWSTDAWKNVTSALDVTTVVKGTEHSFGEGTYHAATCLENAYTEKECSVCGYKKNVTESSTALGHDYGESWKNNGDGTHTGICQREGCDTTATEHIKIEKHILATKPAQASTCIKQGWDEYEYCTKCDYTTQKYNPVDYNNHVGPYENIAEVKATCETAGTTAGKKCTACDRVTEGVTEIPALKHNYVGSFEDPAGRPSENEKGLATYVCQNDPTHFYNLDMDLADYTEFDASLNELKNLAKKDLNKANAKKVADLIAEGNDLPKNLIAGEKGTEYPEPKDQYKHDFGEQGKIEELKAKIDALIKEINDAGEDALATYTATFMAKKTNATGRTEAAVEYEYDTVTYTMESDASVFAAVVNPASYQQGDYTYTFKAWDKTPGIVKGGETYTATWNDGKKDYADYEAFDDQRDRATDILNNNPEIKQEVKDDIDRLIKAGYENNVLGKEYGVTKQETVNVAKKELEDYLNGLYKGGVIDEGNLKHYTIRFFDEDGTTQIGETQSLVKGATVTAPANPTKAADEHHTYKFKAWSPAVAIVAGDQDYVASYDSIDYTIYDEIVKILDEADLDDDARKILDDAKDQIDDDRVADPEDKNTQDEVNKVVEELEKLLDGDKVKDENLKDYKITFIYAKAELDENKQAKKDTIEYTYKKNAAIVEPDIPKHFELKSEDFEPYIKEFDRTYVFTGWDEDDGTLPATVTNDDTFEAKYKVVNYYDFNTLVTNVTNLDLNDDTRDKVNDIVKAINDKKNKADGDKNTQEDVDDAIKAIKDLIYNEDGNVKDKVLNTYTIVFKYRIADGTEKEERVPVVSGNGSEAPEDFVANCHDADYHYLNGKWDKDDYDCVNNINAVDGELVVTAEYDKAAHTFDGGKVTTRPEAVEGAKGVVTYTCTADKCGYSYTEEVDRANYKEYNEAVQRLLNMDEEYDLTEEVIQEISELLEQWKVDQDLVDKELKDDEGKVYNEQKKVDEATEALNAYIVNLENKITEKDPDVLNQYTIIFKWQNGLDTKKYFKGDSVVVPTVEAYDEGGFHHEFIKWNPAVVTVVADDATYTAVYTQPRNMDDVKEAIDKAEDIIGNDDYYDEDQKKVEEAKEELEKYLDEKGVDLDNGQNPIKQGSEEDKKITELVEKLNEAINNANTNKANRDKNKKNTGGFMGWLTRLLILVKHLLGMV